jgi:hypothetical protein
MDSFNQIKNIVLANCITIGVICLILPFMHMDVDHRIFNKGCYTVSYSVRFAS